MGNQIKYIQKFPDYREIKKFQLDNGIETGNSTERLNWLFYNNPFGNASFYCAYNGSKLIGTEVLLPFLLTIGDEIISSTLAVGSLIDKNYRGKGIWKKLLLYSKEESKRKGIKVIWGPPNKNSYPILLNKMNWVKVCSIYYYTFYLKSNPKDNIYKKILKKISLLNLKYRTSFVNTLNIEINNYNNKNYNYKTNEITIFKNNKYFQWRYNEIPDKGYNMRTVYDIINSKTVGVFAYLIKNFNIYIFDYLLLNNDYANIFFLKLQEYAYNKGCSKMIVSMNSISNNKKIFKNSFYKKGNGYDILANILYDDYKDVLTQNIWNFNIGDEDIKFSKPFI